MNKVSLCFRDLYFHVTKTLLHCCVSCLLWRHLLVFLSIVQSAPRRQWIGFIDLRIKVD